MSQQRESRDPHDPIGDVSSSRASVSKGDSASKESGFEDTPMAAQARADNAGPSGAGQAVDGEGRLGEAYGRILTRLEDSGNELSWDGLRAELDEAVRFEAEVEEFTLD